MENATWTAEGLTALGVIPWGATVRVHFTNDTYEQSDWAGLGTFLPKYPLPGQEVTISCQGVCVRPAGWNGKIKMIPLHEVQRVDIIQSIHSDKKTGDHR